jgi:hypothetical protein
MLLISLVLETGDFNSWCWKIFGDKWRNNSLGDFRVLERLIP